MLVQLPLVPPLQQLRVHGALDVQGVGVHPGRVRLHLPVGPLALGVEGAPDAQCLSVHRGRGPLVPDLAQLGHGPAADVLLGRHGPLDAQRLPVDAGAPDAGHVRVAVDLRVAAVDLVAPVVLQRQELAADEAAEAGLVEDDVVHGAHALLLVHHGLAALALVGVRLRGQEEGGEAPEAPGGRLVFVHGRHHPAAVTQT